MQHNFLLNGGGLDSYAYSTILNFLGIKHANFHINYSHLASEAEEKAVQRLSVQNDNTFIERESSCGFIQKSGMLFNKNDSNPFILGRNLSFCLEVVKYCIELKLEGNVNIIFGFTDPGYEPMNDATFEFIVQLNSIISSSYNLDHIKFNIVAPFIKTSRKDLIGLAYIMDKNIFENSMTCWTPRNGNNCGECKHCILQKELIECIIPMTVYKKLNMYELVFNYTVKDLMTKAFNGEY